MVIPADRSLWQIHMSGTLRNNQGCKYKLGSSAIPGCVLIFPLKFNTLNCSETKWDSHFLLKRITFSRSYTFDLRNYTGT